MKPITPSAFISLLGEFVVIHPCQTTWLFRAEDGSPMNPQVEVNGGESYSMDSPMMADIIQGALAHSTEIILTVVNGVSYSVADEVKVEVTLQNCTQEKANLSCQVLLTLIPSVNPTSPTRKGLN